MDGKEVINAHTAIQMFSTCEAMGWNVLPVAGGIYDQHPDFMQKTRYIFGVKAQRDAEEREKQDAERRANERKNRRPPIHRGR